VDGWVGGWMGGRESGVKDCLQQSKIYFFCIERYRLMDQLITRPNFSAILNPFVHKKNIFKTFYEQNGLE
jgi:hypothetical protein